MKWRTQESGQTVFKNVQNLRFSSDGGAFYVFSTTHDLKDDVGTFLSFTEQFNIYANKNKCPSFVGLQSIIGPNGEHLGGYKPNFYDVTPCKGNKSICPIIGELYTSTIVSTSDSRWNYKTNGSGACDQLEFTIFTSSYNDVPVSAANIFYPEGSTFYSKSHKARTH